MSSGDVRPSPPLLRGSAACLHAASVRGHPKMFPSVVMRSLLKVLKEKEDVGLCVRGSSFWTKTCSCEGAAALSGGPQLMTGVTRGFDSQ